jgi:hypothetical protein
MYSGAGVLNSGNCQTATSLRVFRYPPYVFWTFFFLGVFTVATTSGQFQPFIQHFLAPIFFLPQPHTVSLTNYRDV